MHWRSASPPESGPPEQHAGSARVPGRSIAGAQRATASSELPQWQLGTSTRFSFQQETSVQQAGGEPLIAYSLRGTLEVARISDAYARFTFDGELTGLRSGAQTSGLDASRQAALRSELERPFFVELPLTAGSSMVAGRDVSPFVLRNWKSLLENLQFTSGAPGAASWHASESGPLGTCDFAYEVSARGEVTKEATRCEPAGAAATDVRYAAVDLRRVFRFAESARLEALRVSESVRTHASQLSPALDSRNELTLERVGARSLPPKELTAALAEMRGGVAADQSIEAAERTAFDRSRVGGRQFAGIMATLMTLHDRLSDADDRARYEREYVALTALLRLEPRQHLSPIRAHILASGPLQTALISALQDAGTEAAHELMAELVQSTRLSRDAKMELARGLSLTATPSPVSVAALRAIKSDRTYGPQASYGLGASAFKLRQSNPTLRAALTEELIGDLDRAAGDDERLVGLVALGNAGAEGALASIERSASSANENVRAAAAQALRRIAGPTADGLLLALFHDPSPVVRASVLDALGEREPTREGVSRLADACTGEPVYRVRALAVQLAARLGAQVPQLGPTLAKVASEDASEDLRTIARTALSRRGS